MYAGTCRPRADRGSGPPPKDLKMRFLSGHTSTIILLQTPRLPGPHRFLLLNGRLMITWFRSSKDLESSIPVTSLSVYWFLIGLSKVYWTAPLPRPGSFLAHLFKFGYETWERNQVRLFLGAVLEVWRYVTYNENLSRKYAETVRDEAVHTCFRNGMGTCAS